MTPEGRVKARVKKLLAIYDGRIWFYMPVPYGYGKPVLDFIGCFCGHFFAIETKAGDGEPTDRQKETARVMRAAGATTFVVNDEFGEEALAAWLKAVDYEHSQGANIGGAPRPDDGARGRGINARAEARPSRADARRIRPGRQRAGAPQRSAGVPGS